MSNVSLVHIRLYILVFLFSRFIKKIVMRFRKGLGLLVLVALSMAFKPAENEKVKWVSIEDAAKSATETPKIIMIDIYTDWCGWCKRMDATTFNHPDVAPYMNKEIYPVKFDAEQKRDVQLMGRTFKFKPDAGRRGAHELAIELLGGKMSYPSIVFLDENMKIITVVQGYQTAVDFKPMLSFLAEKHYENTTWAEYKAKYTTAE